MSRDEWGWDTSHHFVHIEAEKLHETLFRNIEWVHNRCPDKYTLAIDNLTIDQCILSYKSKESIGFSYSIYNGKERSGSIFTDYELRHALEKRISRERGDVFLEQLKLEISDESIRKMLPAAYLKYIPCVNGKFS